MQKKNIFIIVFSFIILSSCGAKPESENIDLSNPILKISPTISKTMNQTTDAVVSLKTKNGQIVIKLYDQECPKTVANFLSKVNSGFYNGLKFHRVIADFMAQGGDPLGTGTGGGQIASEINSIPFVRGSLGLARGGNREISNDSQFFICFSSAGCQHLTGDYVNFGEVLTGLEVLDQIQQDDLIIEIASTTK